MTKDYDRFVVPLLQERTRVDLTETFKAANRLSGINFEEPFTISPNKALSGLVQECKADVKFEYELGSLEIG